MKRPAFSTRRALRAPRSSRWVPGNHFELLENGEEFFPRVFQAIADARQEVMLETFILFEDQVGQQLHAALLALDRIYVRNATVHSPLALPKKPWDKLSDHAPLAAEILL